MTFALVLGVIAMAFVSGFLLGDRRGVKQCNSILEANWKDLMQAMRDDRTPLAESERDEEPVQPTVH